jgi:hypothetical protein
MRNLILTFALCLAPTLASAGAARPESSPAGAPPPVQVMVVGTFHMGNPGLDLANVETDNMLTDARQAEIAAVAKALAKFKPNVVAVERIATSPDYIDPKFQAFTPEQLNTVADERYQIGYRIATVAGVSRVYGVDEQPSEGEPDYFPLGKLSAHAEATGQTEKLNAKIEEIQRIVGEFGAMQKDHTVGELLIAQNAPADVADNAAFYYRTSEFDRGEDQPGAELQAYWFMRNAKIFSKLMQVTKPGDRVVVVYGAGHKHWLDHFADKTPGYELVDVVPYLKKAARASKRQ